MFPGHEKFIKNMLAGAHGIDIVMMVIAADEGIMPTNGRTSADHLFIGCKKGYCCSHKMRFSG